jgi:UDP-2,3-diacylglucosamine hydrolase
MTALFISDLHLDSERPHSTREFLAFMERRARNAERLYILGDLFEAWIGDDDDDPGLDPILGSLSSISRGGTSCYFMHGNRDFLVAQRFAERTGCRLLGDYEIVELYGERVLLTHGDLLCTDDERYMRLRATVRDPGWQRDFLAKPLAERRKIASEMRAMSRSEVAAKREEIMDVNAATVAATMRKFRVRTLLHGHTHRPGVHRFDLDGGVATRIVLGAWYEHGSCLRWDESGFELEGYNSKQPTF